MTANNVAFPTNAFTVSVWFRNRVSHSNHKSIFTYGASSTPDEVRLLTYYGDQIYVIMKGIVLSGSIQTSDSNWHLLILSWSKSHGNARAYWDGSLDIDSLVSTSAVVRDGCSGGVGVGSGVGSVCDGDRCVF